MNNHDDARESEFAAARLRPIQRDRSDKRNMERARMEEKEGDGTVS